MKNVSEKSKNIVGGISFVVLLTAMAMFITPFMAISTFTDYGHPTVAKWETQNNVKEAKIEFKGGSEEKINAFQKQKLNLPLTLTLGQLIVYSLLLGFLYLILMGFVFDLEHNNDDQVSTVAIFVIAFLFAVMMTVSYASVDYSHQSHEQVIREIIKDGKLADNVVGKYTGELIAMVIIPCGLILCLAFIIGAAHYFFRYLVFADIKEAVEKKVKAYLKNYKEKLFIEIFQQRKDSLFAAFINENKDTILNDIVDEKKETIRNLIEKSQNNLGPNNELIQILPNGAVEIVKYRYDIEYKPFPVLIPQREVISRVSMDNFFRHMVSETKEEAFQELRTLLHERYKDSFQKAGEQAVVDFINTTIKRVKDTFDQTLKGVQISQLNASREYAEKIIQRVSTKTLRKFKEELARIGKEEVSSMLTGLKGNIIKEVQAKIDPMSDIVNPSSETQKDMILPPNTRFYFANGKYQIIAIEQAPFTRNILVDSKLSREDEDRHFNVAFPFVVFLLVFIEGNLAMTYAFYRNQPLQSLDDMLFAPNLTNINDDCVVCLGFHGHRQSGFVNKVNEAITHFWNSTFNNALEGYYDDYRAREERLESFSRWEHESQKDHLFPLSIEWRGVRTLRKTVLQIISGMGRDNGLSSEKIKEEIESAFTSGGEEMEEALKKKFSGINVKGKYSNIITEIVKEHEDKIIMDSAGVAAKSFSSVCGNNHLGDALFEAFHGSVAKTMEEDFSQLAKDVLFRRRGNLSDLIEKIKREDRRN